MQVHVWWMPALQKKTTFTIFHKKKRFKKLCKVKTLKSQGGFELMTKRFVVNPPITHCATL